MGETNPTIPKRPKDVKLFFAASSCDRPTPTCEYDSRETDCLYATEVLLTWY